MKQTIVGNQTVAALLLLTRYQSALCSLCGCLLYRHVILLQYRITDHWPGDRVSLVTDGPMCFHVYSYIGI